MVEYQKVMSERVKKLEQEDQSKRKKELETGRHNPEYVNQKSGVGER